MIKIVSGKNEVTRPRITKQRVAKLPIREIARGSLWIAVKYVVGNKKGGEEAYRGFVTPREPSLRRLCRSHSVCSRNICELIKYGISIGNFVSGFFFHLELLFIKRAFLLSDIFSHINNITN